MEYQFRTDEEFARTLDRDDPLSFRDHFFIPESKIYMDGNSLGLQSRNARQGVQRVLDEWKTLGIGGWLEGNPPWFYYAESLGAKARGLVGALPEEVVATGTTTINLHALVSTFYQPHHGRTTILADELNFPTDIYALRSQIRLKGHDPERDLVLAPSDDGRYLDEQTIVGMMTDDVALVCLPSVLYRSGQLLDIKYLTEEAHKRGIPIGFDCSHSVGVVPHYFDEWGVDFAFWCSYKYMNGGPGSTAFLYVNKAHLQKEPALAGWFGYVKEKQFDMNLEFEHAQSAGGWQISSPSILSSAPLEGALDIILQAGIENIRRKSLMMTSYLMYLVDEILADGPSTVRIGTPREPARRGGHVALEHEEAMRICEALKVRGVIPDFRPPDVIRVAPIPLYTTYHEIWRVVQNLKEVVDTREYETFPPERNAIS
ncbi:MAG: kynureninase [Theionarchaea archaeon]|nr:kynureninase [Theionarchaea archaeon]